MRSILVAVLLPLATTAAAAGYTSKDAGTCYAYAVAAKKPALQSAVEKLADAYGGGRQAVAHGQVFMQRVAARAAQDKKAGAWMLVSEGRAACKAIGAL